MGLATSLPLVLRCFVCSHVDQRYALGVHFKCPLCDHVFSGILSFRYLLPYIVTIGKAPGALPAPTLIVSFQYWFSWKLISGVPPYGGAIISQKIEREARRGTLICRPEGNTGLAEVFGWYTSKLFFFVYFSDRASRRECFNSYIVMANSHLFFFSFWIFISHPGFAPASSWRIK